MNGITPATLLAIAAAIALPAGLLVVVLMGRSAHRAEREAAPRTGERNDVAGGRGAGGTPPAADGGASPDASG